MPFRAEAGGGRARSGAAAGPLPVLPRGRDRLDTLTHGLAGAALAWSFPVLPGAPRPQRHREVWTGFLAAMFPDADALLSPFSPDFYITQHRGLSHSFFLIPLWGLLLAAGALATTRFTKEPGTPHALRRLWVVASVGVLSHILLDWITSWGTMFFSPLDWGRYALDWVFIIDFALSGILVLGLVGAALLARRADRPSRSAARATVVAASLYVAFCGVKHEQAMRVAERVLPAPSRLAAIPQPLSPDRWLVLGDDGRNVSAAFVHLGMRGPSPRGGPTPEEIERAASGTGGVRFILTRLGGLYRSPDDPLIRVIPKGDGPLAWRALKDGEAGVFGRFARYPAAREARDGTGGTRVLVRDVRFGYLSSALDPFTYRVDYDAAGRLRWAGFPSHRWGENGVRGR